jgi:perosamine synthetase
MAISRGSIRHSLGEDFLNFGRSIIYPLSVSKRASAEEKEILKEKVRKRFSTKHAVLFPYARSAFHSILKALDLPKGSEILLTPITIGPMLEVILTLGHKPVFVDIEIKTFCADLDDLKRKLKNRPPCLLLTYLFGYIPDIEAIRALCMEAGTHLIEDISHNIGGKVNGKPLGSFGLAGIYSASLLKYVDGYNGAFILTDDSKLNQQLESDAAVFKKPDPRRICKIIQTTFIWNFCLRRLPFNCFVFPILWLLKMTNPFKFEKILGPKIALEMPKEIPKYYFEDISSMQCRTIARHLDKLETLLSKRIEAASRAANAYEEVMGASVGFSSHFTYWQFIVPTSDLAKARNALFKIGVETGATNLMNLAEVSGIELSGAKSLKKNHIFIPVHEWISEKNYQLIFKTISNHKGSCLNLK